MSIDWIFGEYKILKKIATGGMAEVFLAKRVGVKGFEKLLAIKRILPQFSENEEFISMFIDEAKLAAQLNHRNIVQIYDFGNQQGSYYIAMEYVFGKDLRTILKKSKEKKKKLPLAELAYIIKEAARGLEYAHDAKDPYGNPLHIIHRDVSPQNIFISYEGDVKIADFGIAKAASKSTETRAGVLKGKILYMSPEQAWGKMIDRRSALYSLGVLFYEMVTDRKIVEADSEFSMLEKVRNAEVEFPPEIFGNLPQPLFSVMKKALEREPSNRYKSAYEMRLDLENYLLSIKETLSEKKISDYLKDLFEDEIEEERKILIEGAEVPAERTIPIELAVERTAQESQKISSEKRAVERIEPPEKKGALPPTKQPIGLGGVRMRIGMILILLMLGGAVSFYLLSDKPSPTTTIPAERRLPSSAPIVSSSAVEVVAEQPREKPKPGEEKPKSPEKSPSTPASPSSPSIAKPTPADKPSESSEGRKPDSQPEPETKPSTPPAPVEKPKTTEEARKPHPVEKPDPTTKPEREASLRPPPEPRPYSVMNDLISQGPQLLAENRQLKILEQIQRLTPEERQNINVKVLECFAYLKRYVVDKDKQSKPSWGHLYEFLERSNNRNATPLLIRITRDREEYTRLYAVTLLGSIGDMRAIADLERIATSDPNRKIRRSAAKSVALIQRRR